ncbi:MAG: hypothetical protein ACFFCM_12615 [Promethearchaeota archaeon]
MGSLTYNFCPYCGKKLPKSNIGKPNYCCYCGKKLSNKKDKSITKAHCTICHRIVDLHKHRIIRCSFCESLYHESCVTSWLEKYNACPMCQNVYLFPQKTLILQK